MTRRQILLAGTGVLALFGIMRLTRRQSAVETNEVFETMHSDAEWRQQLTPAQYTVLRQHRMAKNVREYSPAQAAAFPCSHQRPNMTAAPDGQAFGGPSTTRLARPTIRALACGASRCTADGAADILDMSLTTARGRPGSVTALTASP